MGRAVQPRGTFPKRDVRLRGVCASGCVRDRMLLNLTSALPGLVTTHASLGRGGAVCRPGGALLSQKLCPAAADRRSLRRRL